MHSNNNKNLIVISVPFWRVGKVLLSDTFLSSLEDKKNDIVIIGPLNFEAIKSNLSINFDRLLKIKWKPKFSTILFRIYNISEVARMNGYWFRYRKSTMKYHYRNMYFDFEEHGNDQKKKITSRIILFLLSWMGCIPQFWKFLDVCISKWYDYSSILDLLSDEYQNTVLIQSCSWGEQDRILAAWARKKRADTYFIPYTTDQITMNGYLLSKYKKIFIQGPIEYSFAIKEQNIHERYIYKAGSMWFRNIDSLLKVRNIKKNGNEIKKIMYAGVLPLYYSRFNELSVVKKINEFLKQEDSNISFVYRPYITGENDKKIIKNYLQDCNSMNIQWPDMKINSLTNNEASLFWETIQAEIEQMQDIDIFIMSVSTSMSIDVSYLSKCDVISILIDEDGVLSKRLTQECLVENNTLFYVPGAELIYNIDSLFNNLKKKIRYTKESCNVLEYSYKRIIESWDYNNKEFPNCIKDIILNPITYEKAF